MYTPITPNVDRIILSDTRVADVDTSRYNGKPVIRIFENGVITPGQWFAATIAESKADRIAIDSGQGWSLTPSETVAVIGFAGQVAAR